MFVSKDGFSTFLLGVYSSKIFDFESNFSNMNVFFLQNTALATLTQRYSGPFA